MFFVNTCFIPLQVPCILLYAYLRLIISFVRSTSYTYTSKYSVYIWMRCRNAYKDTAVQAEHSLLFFTADKTASAIIFVRRVTQQTLGATTQKETLRCGGPRGMEWGGGGVCVMGRLAVSAKNGWKHFVLDIAYCTRI